MTTDTKPTITIDDTSYNLEDLSPEAIKLVDHLHVCTNEITRQEHLIGVLRAGYDSLVAVLKVELTKAEEPAVEEDTDG